MRYHLLKKRNFFKSNPSSLYKYRVWDDDFHKRLITKQELYFQAHRNLMILTIADFLISNIQIIRTH